MDRIPASLPVRKAGRSAWALVLWIVSSGCTTYEEQPLSPIAILRDLRQHEPPLSELQGERGLTPDQLTVWALAHNPGLVAFRRQLGVAEFEIAVAGMLPDPQIGWGAMDALAVKLVGENPKAENYLSGIDLSWRVPRPGEIDAQVGVAEASRETAQQRLLAAEWQLVQDVRLAAVDLLGARQRLALLEAQAALAGRTARFFDEALEVGGASALAANLAASELSSVQQEALHAQGEVARREQALNELLGLAPDTELTLRSQDLLEPTIELEPDIAALVDEAVERRPDLQARVARYREAEESLRLEVARQWPQIAVGTGLWLTLPIFSRFNAPAIEAARMRRAMAAAELESAVFTLRAEVHAAVLELQWRTRELRAIVEDLLPHLERALELSDEAFRLREVTLLEMLTTQRTVLDGRLRHLEARIARARSRTRVDALTGAVFGGGRGELGDDQRGDDGGGE